MRVRAWLLAALILVSLVATTWVGVNLFAGSVVDGWPIGPLADCANNRDARCPALLPFARQAFDEHNPGHAAIVSVQMHEEGDASGILMTRSSHPYVVVFHLADGSTRAIGVLYPGVSDTPIALDHGP